MLLDVQAYIRQRQRVSLKELQQHFYSAPQMLEEILAQLERKGRIEKLSSTSCSGCCHCSQADFEVYQWKT